jgi:RNA polymerase sigma-70 factor (ECF subfamily)
MVGRSAHDARAVDPYGGPVTSPPFESVLLAAQAGADWAVAELYRAHNPKIARYLKAQEPADHEDIASETWIDAARNLRTFTGDEDGFAGWLFTIARRRLVDHRRARLRRPADPVPPEGLGHLAVPSAELSALDGLIGDAAARRLVELLPSAQAEVLLLRVVADLDVATVADITGRRPGAVRALQHRALRRLARSLDPTRNAREEASDGAQRDANAPHPPR